VAAKGIESKRIEGERRKNSRYQVHEDIGRRGIECPTAHQTINRRALQRTKRRGARHPPPKSFQRSARAFRSAFSPTVCQQRGIHCARRRPRNTGNVKPWLFKQAIQHAPRKRPVRAATLKRKINQYRTTVHGIGPLLLRRHAAARADRLRNNKRLWPTPLFTAQLWRNSRWISVLSRHIGTLTSINLLSI